MAAAVSAVAGVQWAVASRPLAGQSLNGDAAWTWTGPGLFRVAVIDGLGHGREAALASQTACAFLDTLPGAPLSELLQGLHEALRRTRGAALALAEADLLANTWHWGGVGNIAGLLLSPQGKTERLICRSGILGVNHLPGSLIRQAGLAPGCQVVLHSDGMTDVFPESLSQEEDLGSLAARLLGDHARPSDDALVWVGRAYG